MPIKFCINCGAKRRLGYYNHDTGLCKRCLLTAQRGERNPNWRGGRTERYGRPYVRLSPANPYYPMANQNGYVREHRLVVAKGLGRCLNAGEVVHHLNGDMTDNNPENLALLPNESVHRKVHCMSEKLEMPK